MAENENETLILEDIEKPGEISDEPIFGKSLREIRLGSNRHTKVKTGHSYCKKCGRPLTNEKAVRCSDCLKLVCRDCSIVYTNAIHCQECLRDVHQIFLTKENFMISHCISNEFSGSMSIFKLTGIEPQKVKERISSLMNTYLTNKPTNFIERIFPKLRLTNLGNDALQVFDSIYGKDADVQILKQKIAELKAEKEKDYRLLLEEDECSQQNSSKIITWMILIGFVAFCFGYIYVVVYLLSSFGVPSEFWVLIIPLVLLFLAAFGLKIFRSVFVARK